MPRHVATSIENSFVNGLVTEASALNFPESACTETYNCVFNPTGLVTRRKGFALEAAADTLPVTRSNGAINTYLWQNAGGLGDNNFVVVQVGDKLQLFRVDGSGSVSGNWIYQLDLNGHTITGAVAPGSFEAQFAAGKGYLFVTHPSCETFYVAYDADEDTFSEHPIELFVRDFDGFISEYGVDGRPSGDITPQHHYNLRNQGWPQSRIDEWSNRFHAQPSNADVWWLFKDAQDEFKTDLANTILRGNSPAPKGYFVLPALRQDRSEASGIPDLPMITAGTARPTAVEFFAGRVFYAGVNAHRYNNKIFFSQTVENEQQFGRCHQVNDPTSEYSFDLLPTDGGVITILEAGTIVRMISMEASLVVFADNGVWQITGSTGTGFAANDYTVKRISNIGALSSSTFVNVGGIPAWWNSDGIYTITIDSTLGRSSINSMTEKKIKQFFETIPEESKKYAKGYYNSLTRVVQWLYRQAPTDTFEDRYDFDRVLNFSTITGAFYPWEIPATSQKINGVVVVQGTGSTLYTTPVTDTVLVNVTTLGGTTVETEEAQATDLAHVFKYVTTTNTGGTAYNLSFAEERDETLKDWGTVDYSSYLISGFKVHGDAQRKFQSNYAYLFSKNENPSTYTISALWDYSTNSGTGRWSIPQTITHVSSPYSNRWKRVKLRGQGLALQIKINSVSGQPFDLIGWSLFETGNASV